MNEPGLDNIEAQLIFARTRAAVLAQDVANARTPGFIARDVQMVQSTDPAGAPFAAALQNVNTHGAVGALEYAMGAQARNAIAFRALTDQERAMLREVRTVAEEARR